MESSGLALGSLTRLSRGVFTGTASERLEEHVPRGQSHAAWRLSLSSHVRAAPRKPHLVLHWLLPAALWPRTRGRWECWSFCCGILGGGVPTGRVSGWPPRGTPGGRHLQGAPGGHAWRTRLEDMPGGRRLEDAYGITDSMDMSLSKLQELVMDRKPGVLQSMGSQRVGHD